MTGGWLDIAAKIVGLGSPFILAILAWVFKKRIDDAQARATEAQARATDAGAEKTRVETSGLAITNAVTAAEKIVALYQAQQERDQRVAEQERARKDEDAAKFRASAEEKIATLEKQVAGLEETQRGFAIALLPHVVWDGQVWRDARDLIDPEYQPPPPFGLDGLPEPASMPPGRAAPHRHQDHEHAGEPGGHHHHDETCPPDET